MAVHTGHLPRTRLAPPRQRVTEERSKHGFSLATPMGRLNHLTADADLRLRATGLFVVGLTALVAALSVL